MTGHKGWYHCTKLYCTWLVPSKVFIPFSPSLFTKPAANTASFLHVCTWCVDYQRRRAIAYASLVTCVQCVYLCLHVCVHIFTIASPSSTHNHSRQPRQYSQLLHATSSSIHTEAPPAQHMYTTKKKKALTKTNKTDRRCHPIYKDGNNTDTQLRSSWIQHDSRKKHAARRPLSAKYFPMPKTTEMRVSTRHLPASFYSVLNALEP